MQRNIIITATVLGALAVILGAFGAHGLKDILEQSNRLDTFETATKYHFYHSLFLLMIGFAMNKYKSKFISYSAFFIMMGVFLFSGSLYVLSIFDIARLGIITPFGGISFVIGWLIFGIGMSKSIQHHRV